MEIKKIKVGTRSSPLARVQAKEILSLLAEQGTNISFEEIVYETHGDRDKRTPLTDNLPEDFFTDTLDQAILNNEIDLAIHSAKDLPKKITEGLEIFALTKSLDNTDAFVGKVKFSELKPGSKVGTSSFLRQKSLKELNPRLKIIGIRGTITERIQLVEKGICDGVIIATIALKRLGLKHLVKDIMPWEGTPLQGQLAVVGRKKDTLLREIFIPIDIRRSFGRVYLVGAGPGDPDLITLKGLKILQKADCIFYDYLAPKQILDSAPNAQKIYVGKRKSDHTMAQEQLNKFIRQKAMEGKIVARLKGGDPLVFGRGAEEIEYLKTFHIEVEVIPGVSSATGLPSALGIPLTARGVSSSVAFLSGHERDEKSDKINLPKIPEVDTIVFLMGLTKLEEIILSLRKKGWRKTTPIIVISKGTYSDEKNIFGTLEDIKEKVAKENLSPPALIVVGEVVKFFKGDSSDPLVASSILYTGTNPGKYQTLGNMVHFPMIEISQVAFSPERLQSLLEELNSCDIILLTSRFGVNYLFKLLKKNNYNLLRLREKNWIVIGQETKTALKKQGFESIFVAQEESSEGLIKELEEKFPLRRKKILFPRSSLPNPYLKEKLTALGNSVKEIIVYENVKPAKRKLPEDGIQKIIFTSPSTVKNFLKDYKNIPSHWKILSKGTLTQKTLSKSGYQSEVIQ